MKKIGVLILFLVFLILVLNLFSSQAKAQDMPNVPFSSEGEKIQQISENFQDKETASSYLKHEWSKILNNSRLGPVFNAITKTDNYMLFLFGVPIRLSWAFVFLFFLIILSVIFFHNLPGYVGIKEEWVKITSALGITLVLGIVGVFEWIVTWIVRITTAWWFKLIIIAAIIAIIAVQILMSKLKREKNLEKAIKSADKGEISKLKKRVGELEDESKYSLTGDMELKKPSHESHESASKKYKDAGEGI